MSTEKVKRAEEEIPLAKLPDSAYLRHKYLHESRLPTMFCSGCGLGIIINLLTRAFESLGINKDKTVLVSGIGCTARIPGYFDLASFHTTHGRAIPVATAIKITNPELNVIVISGDGDLIGIGGNHFIHAVRRNVGIKVIMANNYTYGMTGGQNSPTTPHGAYSTSYPWIGNPEDNIDASALSLIGDAPFVARWTVFDTVQLYNSMKKMLKIRGFSFLEVISPCPTNFGRRNNIEDAAALRKWLEERVRPVSKSPYKDGKRFESFIDHDIKDIFTVGEFRNKERPTFEDKWKETCRVAKELYLKSKENGLI